MKEEAIGFYEIYGYYYQPIWQNPYFNFIMVSLALLLFIVGIYFVVKYWLKRKRKEILPWEWACQEMQLLKPKDCSSRSDYKKFYFDLTLIIKKYLRKRFDWQTEDKTDEELVGYLKLKSFDKQLLSQLTCLLQGALMVKFAGQDVLRLQAEKDLTTAFFVVKNTVPVENKSN